MSARTGLGRRVRGAIRHFWKPRDEQATKQGFATGNKDAGARSAVTGGAQMNGFVNLVRELLCEVGLKRTQLHCESCIELPGWYRPEKRWDLLFVSDGQLIARIEFKSQVGPSFGNNYNNRTEEAIGSASDLWAAYREGAFKLSSRPWLGYLMLLEESSGSINPVRNREPHPELTFEKFTASLLARAIAIAKASQEADIMKRKLALAKTPLPKFASDKEAAEYFEKHSVAGIWDQLPRARLNVSRQAVIK